MPVATDQQQFVPGILRDTSHRQPTIMLPLHPQDHLDKLARKRLWHALKGELFPLLNAVAAEATADAGMRVGISSDWEIILRPREAVVLRGLRVMGPRDTDGVMRLLKSLADRHPTLLAAPYFI